MNLENTMTLKKSTKGTHVYEATDDTAAVKTVYVARCALPNNPVPPTIKLIIEHE